MARGTFELIPRYSAGSPAMVHDGDLARRVAREEAEGYERHMEGVYGPHGVVAAQAYGKDGIVLERLGDYRFLDMITQVEYKDFPYAAIRNPGKLVVWFKGREERYFYGFKQVIALPTRKSGDNMMLVMKRLQQDANGIDPFSEQAFTMWRDKIEVH